MAGRHDTIISIGAARIPLAFNTATSVQSPDVATTNTHAGAFIRFRATQNCFIAIGLDPVATLGVPGTTAASYPLIANVPEVIQVSNNHKVAVIGETASGTLYMNGVI